MLYDLLQDLPQDKPLRAVKVFGTRDGSLVLDLFKFGDPEPFDITNPTHFDKAKELEEAFDSDEKRAMVRTHLKNSCAEYAMAVTALRLERHADLFKRVAGTDGVLVEVEAEVGEHVSSRLVVAASNSRPRRLLERCAYLLGVTDFNIFRAYLDVFDDPGNGKVTILTFVGTGLDPASEAWHSLRRDLLLAKWLGANAWMLQMQHPGLGVLRAECLMGLLCLLHQTLVSDNPFEFAKDHLVRMATQYSEHAVAIVDLFLTRFDPDHPNPGGREAECAARAAGIALAIDEEVAEPEYRRALLGLIGVVKAVLRTNVYVEDRFALGLKLNPTLLPCPDGVPNTVLFVLGGGFTGFHIRWRNLARGGVRVLRTCSEEEHMLETAVHYRNTYAAAQSQQLRNKDVPEGGSKGVILLTHMSSVERSVKAYARTLIDLCTPDPRLKTRMVDLAGKDELLYLGPDDDGFITPSFIDWIVQCGERCGIPQARALITSKRQAGVNHKAFGVTSEGVAVFLDMGLRASNIDPTTQPFTVALTGGPDGDIAGNSIKILVRLYKNQVRFIGIADASGLGEDPEGLDHAELLRLVAEQKPIAMFNKLKLGPKGRIISVSERGGRRLANSLHLRLCGDAFIPAGGSRKFDVDSLEPFLEGQGGLPRFKVLVECNNPFITATAREALAKHSDIVFVECHSATKCGVICSSYEVLASMVFSEEDFLKHKPYLVQQILERLRQLASREATFLLREYLLRRDGPTVAELSEQLSQGIDAVSASLYEYLVQHDPEVRGQLWARAVRELPPLLARQDETVLRTRVATDYWRWAAAKAVAADLLYHEGPSFITGLAHADLATLALRWAKADDVTQGLLEEVRTSGVISDTARLAEVLELAGTRGMLAADLRNSSPGSASRGASTSPRQTRITPRPPPEPEWGMQRGESMSPVPHS